MRILLVTPRYTPYIGGVEYVVKSVAERLAKMGHDVTVLAGEPSARQVKEEFINRVKVIRWPTQVFREAYHIPRMRNKLESLACEKPVVTSDLFEFRLWFRDYLEYY